MVALRQRLGVAFDAVQTTEVAAEAAMDAAAMCRGVDLRDPSGSKRKASDPATAKSSSAGEAMAASKACEAPLRLWMAVRAVDLTSEVTSASVASHITELTLPAGTAAVRTTLVRALRDHAKALKDFMAVAQPASTSDDEEMRSLVALRSEVLAKLQATAGSCRTRAGDLARVHGGQPEPRSATVTVRPKWTGSLATLPHPEEFGSGFVVRWRNAKGDVEARIVTNNHVMDGAFEAEILAGDPHLAKPGQGTGDSAHAWSATLIQSNPHDDVAILRLDDDAQRVFTEGFALRLAPAKEEESVVAAGFPGIGARPSFQVTKGTVSNAKFSTADAAANALDVYVQHTAAIDPGNSGGPLLDGNGRLLGMNTLKLVGRENVGLAIPTWRIHEALLRAENRVSLDPRHAQASCNAAVSALAATHPVGDAASRFGLALYEWSESHASPTDARSYAEGMAEGTGDPVDDARRRAYGVVRAQVEKEGGVRPFEACSELHPGTAPGTMVATFRTRKGTHQLTLAEEHSVMRVVAFE